MKYKHSLLIVDDEESILKSLRRLFRNEDFDISIATSGFEGLKQIREAEMPFSLIISDQRMPEMTGSQFLAEAREILPDAMRVILTGYADMESIIAAINDGGIHRYLTKPWKDEELLLQGSNGQACPDSGAGWRGSPVGRPYCKRHSSI